MTLQISVPSMILIRAQPPARVRNCWKCAKPAGQILADIAEKTAVLALVTYFKVVKKDVFGSLLLFSVYAKLKKGAVFPNSGL